MAPFVFPLCTPLKVMKLFVLYGKQNIPIYEYRREKDVSIHIYPFFTIFRKFRLFRAASSDSEIIQNLGNQNLHLHQGGNLSNPIDPRTIMVKGKENQNV